MIGSSYSIQSKIFSGGGGMLSAAESGEISFAAELARWLVPDPYFRTDETGIMSIAL